MIIASRRRSLDSSLCRFIRYSVSHAPLTADAATADRPGELRQGQSNQTATPGWCPVPRSCRDSPPADHSARAPLRRPVATGWCTRRDGGGRGTPSRPPLWWMRLHPGSYGFARYDYGGSQRPVADTSGTPGRILPPMPCGASWPSRWSIPALCGDPFVSRSPLWRLSPFSTPATPIECLSYGLTGTQDRGAPDWWKRGEASRMRDAPARRSARPWGLGRKPIPPAQAGTVHPHRIRTSSTRRSGSLSALVG